jgi:hypothetical protein
MRQQRAFTIATREQQHSGHMPDPSVQPLVYHFIDHQASTRIESNQTSKRRSYHADGTLFCSTIADHNAFALKSIPAHTSASHF